MEKVKRLVEAGSSISGAIKESLGMSMAAFAEKHGRHRVSVTDEINGNRRASDATIAALVDELGGTSEEWRALLWLASKPTHLTEAPAA